MLVPQVGQDSVRTAGVPLNGISLGGTTPWIWDAEITAQFSTKILSVGIFNHLPRDAVRGAPPEFR